LLNVSEVLTASIIRVMSKLQAGMQSVEEKQTGSGRNLAGPVDKEKESVEDRESKGANG
jgi:hypothetical protein